MMRSGGHVCLAHNVTEAFARSLNSSLCNIEGHFVMHFLFLFVFDRVLSSITVYTCTGVTAFCTRNDGERRHIGLSILL